MIRGIKLENGRKKVQQESVFRFTVYEYVVCLCLCVRNVPPLHILAPT